MQDFGFDFFSHKRSRRLVLCGHPGCGKTQLGKALCRWAGAVSMLAWERGHYSSPPGSLFLQWQEVCDRLEDSRASMVQELSEAIESPLLVVDDIGAESDRFKSGKGIDALCYLLTRRQDSGFTLLTTNVLPARWKERWDARVDDRLKRNSEVVDMSQCPSWTAV